MRIKLIAFVIILNLNLIYAQNGIVKSYFINGNKSAELSYTNDVYDGTCVWYYENGNVKEEKTFSMGKLNGWVRKYYENGLVEKEYYVNNGLLDCLFKNYYKNGGLKEVLKYKAGRLISKEEVPYDSHFDPPISYYSGANRIEKVKKKKEIIICDAEICPEPLGGMKTIYNNLIYPEHAKMYGLQGNVKLIASVNSDGRVENVTVIEGIGLGCDEAAADAVMKSRFLPGMRDGKNASSNVTLQIEFKLDEDDLALASSLNDNTDKQREANLDELIQNRKKDNVNYLQLSKNDSTVEKAVQVHRNLECSIDVCPTPMGGMTALMENLVIPQRAFQLGLEGEIVIIADVDKYGYVRDTDVIKGLGHGCDEAAEVAVLETKFEPGFIGKEAVRASVKLIVPFRLEEKIKTDTENNNR